MDVPDGGEYEAKLYKASGDLIPEIRHKLPQLIWHPGSSQRRLRTFVINNKTAELVHLLDRFQEWPQLLDPYLAEIIGTLVDGFLQSLPPSRDTYFQLRNDNVSPLSRAICRILCAFCKVRGYKVIVRLLNNEPKYIEPMLLSFRSWSSGIDNARERGPSAMIWEERYVVILWLSHLMLAPFQLGTISDYNLGVENPGLDELLTGLPQVAKEILMIGFDQVQSPSKEREAACILLVRLALRRDMQELFLLDRIMKYTIRLLMSQPQQELSTYSQLGHLALLYGILNSGSDSEVSSFLIETFQQVNKILTSTSSHLKNLCDSAPARKLLMKILRVCTTHAISLASTPMSVIDGNILNAMLEDTIQHLLDALKDKDTPVRMAASKALSVVTLTLEPSMSADVVEAVLGSLNEDVLFEDSKISKSVISTGELIIDRVRVRKNLSAVDPLRWHGLMLTLGHLLFRRSPPAYQLPDIIEALVLGLEFEQRSNVGTSIGVVVRDAACFGIWAIARKYSTFELESVDISQMTRAWNDIWPLTSNALQFLAGQLVVSACFDPSGNIRRGSSAALQELIGRHPDTIIQGISVVQVVDYHAVARRSKAMIDVADQAALLDLTYRLELTQAVLSWRGYRAADADSRRSAGVICKDLLRKVSLPDLLLFLQRIRSEIEGLKPSNTGSNAAARQGLLLCLAGIVELGEAVDEQANQNIQREVRSIDIQKASGVLEGRTTIDLELVMEATCKLIRAISRNFLQKAHTSSASQAWIHAIQPILNRCTVASEKDILVEASAEANLALFNLLDDKSRSDWLDEWLDAKIQRATELTCRGRLMALSSFCKNDIASTHQERIVGFLSDVVQDNPNIETRKNAMESVCLLLSGTYQPQDVDVRTYTSILEVGLTDYTIDQRGDVGSILRVQTVEATELLCEVVHKHSWDGQSLHASIQYVTRLAGEKLSRVRFRAWQCLQRYLQLYHGHFEFNKTFDQLTDVSTEKYYRQLMELLQIEWLQHHLVKGLMSSVVSGADEIGRASWNALLSFLLQLQPERMTEMQYKIASYTVNHLAEIALQDDREVVPVLQFMSVLIEAGFIAKTSVESAQSLTQSIRSVMQQIQTTKASFSKLEGVICVYGAMLSVDCESQWVLDKLTRLLLHRWPKIRDVAADLVFTYTLNDSIASRDWNSQAAQNKPAVLQARKLLDLTNAGSG